MKTRFVTTIIALLCSIISWAAGNNRLIISLHSEAKPNLQNNKLNVPAIDAVAQQFGCTNIHAIKTGKVYVLTLPDNANLQEATKAMLATRLCKYAEADATATIGEWKTTAAAPTDTLFYQQWGLHNTGVFSGGTAKAGADIDLLRAWDIETGDSNIVVAVIDAGIKSNHPDVQGRLWRNKTEIPANGIDDDGNDYVDDTMGWNMVIDTNNIEDDHGHGSHVAGIIGASVNNVTGMAGVDQHCKLMILKGIDQTGFVAYSWMTEAIYYAVDNGARVVNISAGGLSFSNIVQDAVTYAVSKKVTVLAAMMNSGLDQKFYPAACTGVIAVGATDAEDKRASFSTFGNHISVCAPGHQIYSLSHLYDTAYVMMSGTSMATPCVAGVAALLLAQDSTRTPAQIKNLLESNAEDMVGESKDVAGFDKYYGNGRVNAWRALTNARLSVNNMAAAQQWTVYPNPATDVLYIGAVNNESYAVQMMSVTGAVVYTASHTGKAAIPVAQLAKGSYVLRLQQGGSVQHTSIVLH